MKGKRLKKIFYIFLILIMIPCFSAAREEYPYLPMHLSKKAVEVLNINTLGKSLVYEKVKMYDNFDTWMIAWVDNNEKIVAGITDAGDIIYYSIADFEGNVPISGGQPVNFAQGEEIAKKFLEEIMSGKEMKLISSDAFEYTFAQCKNSIEILGRRATVVVDKKSGQVCHYTGFGQVDMSYILMNSIISEQKAFNTYYENIGLELVYDTLFDDVAKIRAIRPMYILNRKEPMAVDAQTGKPVNIVMYDYNYYYSDEYFDYRYFYDNNIKTEEKEFTVEKAVYGENIFETLKLLGFDVYDGYTASTKKGVLNFYKNPLGEENSYEVLQIDIVPSIYGREIEKFTKAFDGQDLNLLKNTKTDSPIKFARIYVEKVTGKIFDLEIVENEDYVSSERTELNIYTINNFVKKAAGDTKLKYYGMYQYDENQYGISYARYENGIRVIGEGVHLIYDASLGRITDYSMVITKGEFLPASVMKTHGQMKNEVEKEFDPTLYYVDKNYKKKFVVYDAGDKNMAFDPVTGNRIDIVSGNGHIICLCSVGSNKYTVSGIPAHAPTPVVRSNSLMLPLEFICSLMEKEVNYQNGKIVISGGRDVIEISGNSAILNGKKVQLDVAPASVGGTMYISAMSLRKLFGMYTSWDGEIIQIIK